jgi:hypothetical protein
MVTTRSERVKQVAPGLAVTAVVAAGVFLLAYDAGGYGLESRTTAAIVLIWAASLAVVLGLWPVVRPQRGALVTLGFLAAFCAWTGLSVFWAESAERAFLEFDRVVLLLAVLAVAILAGTRRTLRRWTDGLALAIAAVGVLALASRLFPNTFPKGNIPEFLPSALTRLSWPVEYWNGLALLVALGLPLLLRAAAEPRNPLVRGAAIGVIPALAGTMYLTSSRGGFAAAAVGLVVFLVFTARRWAAGLGLALGLAGSAFVISRLVERSTLANEPFSAEAASQGRSAALLVLLACLACAAVFALAVAYVPPVRVPRAVGIAVVVVLAGAAVATIVAADPVRRFEDFKAMPTEYDEADFVKAHLLSGSGNGRWQFWGGAIDQWQEDPVVGQGAGSFEAWWASNGSFTYFIKDAHSLYAETLGELGLIGFVLLAATFLAAVVVGLDRLRRAAGEHRTEIAALLGVLAAYLVAAGIDWVWELTVVSVVAFAAIGLLVGPATGGVEDESEADVPRRDRSRTRRLVVGAAALLTGWLLILGQAIPFLSHLEISESQAAVRRGDGEAALESARSARSIQPWAASPHLQLAFVHEVLGDLPAARDAIEDAIERDPLDWRLWLVRTRLETKSGDIAEARESLARVRELNAHSPLFAPRE